MRRCATTHWRAGVRRGLSSSSSGGGPGKAWTLPEVAEQWEAFNENEAIDENLGLWGQIKLFSSLMSYDVHPHFEPSEFVEGAQAAYVSMHTMMHSQAFVNAVAGHSDDADGAAGQMRSMLSPRCYRIISETMAAADQMGQRWTVERCDVSVAGLSALRVHRFGNPWQRRLTFATLGFTDESVEDVQRLMFEITADPGRKDELLFEIDGVPAMVQVRRKGRLKTDCELRLYVDDVLVEARDEPQRPSDQLGFSARAAAAAATGAAAGAAARAAAGAASAVAVGAAAGAREVVNERRERRDAGGGGGGDQRRERPAAAQAPQPKQRPPAAAPMAAAAVAAPAFDFFGEAPAKSENSSTAHLLADFGF